MKKQLLFILILLSTTIYAQDYTLDPNFGNNGMVISNFLNYDDDYYDYQTYDNIVLDNGVIFILTKTQNNTYLVKFLSNGDLDLSFGTDGYLNLNLNSNIYVSGLNKTNDNKILIAGEIGTYPNYSSYKERRLDNGSLDTSFADNGIFIDPLNSYTTLLDNSDLFYFENVVIDNINYLNILKYNNFGDNLDTSFGDNGILTTFISNLENHIQKKLIKNNTLFVYTFTHDANQYNYYVTSFSLDGTLNIDFGNNGTLNYYTSSSNKNISSIIKDNGKILLAIPNNTFCFFKQYTANGVLDDTFGNDGVAENDLDYSDAMYGFYLRGILSKTDGGFIIIGGINQEEDSQLILNGFEENGIIDSNFLFNFSNSYQYINAKLLNDESILVLGGTYWYGLTPSPVLERYIPNVLNINSYDTVFSIYPNPVKNNIHIKAIKTNTNFKIIDLLGKELINGKLSSLESKVDVSALRSGIYFIRLDNTSYKFIKK